LHLCKAYAGIATQKFHEAKEQLAFAAVLASKLECGRDDVECKCLEALVLRRLGEDSEALLEEATSLATMFGLERIVADTHPDLLRGASPPPPGRKPPGRSLPSREKSVLPTELLTPKERDVLGLLAQGMPNKQIAVAASVSRETVKWHMKNLLIKLDAADRAHAIKRAYLLGILG
jgi:LuxR family maltose regulon positive regulatory protein